MTDNADPQPPPKSIALAQVNTLFVEASLRIGDKVRALALGVIAFAWAVLSAEKPPVSNLHSHHPLWLLATALLAVISLLADLLQSLANYVEFDRLRKTIEDSGAQYGEFRKKSFLHRFADAAFWVKTGACVLSCLSLLVLVPVSL